MQATRKCTELQTEAFYVEVCWCDAVSYNENLNKLEPTPNLELRTVVCGKVPVENVAPGWMERGVEYGDYLAISERHIGMSQSKTLPIS